MFLLTEQLHEAGEDVVLDPAVIPGSAQQQKAPGDLLKHLLVPDILLCKLEEPDDQVLRLVGAGPVVVVLLQDLLGLIHHHLGAVHLRPGIKHTPDKHALLLTYSLSSTSTTHQTMVSIMGVWDNGSPWLHKKRSCFQEHRNELKCFLPGEHLRPERDDNADQDVIAGGLEVEQVVDEVLDNLDVVTVPVINQYSHYHLSLEGQ